MTCKEIENLLDAYVDGELDLVHNLEIEQHLPDCPACLQIYENQQALKKALKAPALYFKPPSDLQKRLHTSLQSYSRPVTATRRRTGWLVAAALLGLFVLAASFIWLTSTRGEDQLTQEVVASHIRSLMVNHLADVASSDQHTVKPWFNGKLDFAPPVQDLTEKGFPLTGGRLDYLNGRAVATLIYMRHDHKINLFIWPVGAEGEKDAEPKSQTRQGYNIIHWTKGGMTFWAISDLNNSELGELVQLLRQSE